MIQPFKYIAERYKTIIERSNYVFLCSHMRGYTSLFSHILGSHNEIKGYSEMHQSYRSNLGLIQLRLKSKITTKQLTTPKFLFDKLLHNKYKIANAILNKQNVYPILMIREPQQTIKSIINMGQKMHNVSWYTNQEKVAEYYCHRLKTLEKIAQRSKESIPFIEGYQLIDNTDKTLTFITDYLQLESPLQKDYNTFSLTGTALLGDPSEHIKKGKIVKERDKYSHITLSEHVLTTTLHQYDKTKHSLSTMCRTI